MRKTLGKIFDYFLAFTIIYLIITGIWLIFNRANPLYLFTFAYPSHYVLATLEASDLKPHWEAISKDKGDCRIQNTIVAIKNPNLYIVFGKVYDPETQAGGNHLWATSNPEKPNVYQYIVDNTTGSDEEVKRIAHYIPHMVYKLDVKECKLIPIKQCKKLTDKEEFLVKAGKFYVEVFCKKYKEKWM